MFLDYNYFRGKSMIKLESDKWIEGYAFSVHTLYSIYVGENGFKNIYAFALTRTKNSD